MLCSITRVPYVQRAYVPRINVGAFSGVPNAGVIPTTRGKRIERLSDGRHDYLFSNRAIYALSGSKLHTATHRSAWNI